MISGWWADLKWAALNCWEDSASDVLGSRSQPEYLHRSNGPETIPERGVVDPVNHCKHFLTCVVLEEFLGNSIGFSGQAPL